MGQSWLVILLLLVSASSFAAPPRATLVYQGRLLKADGTPVEGTIPFRIQVRSPSDTDCLMYEETRSMTIEPEKKGAFAFEINGPGRLRTDANLYPFEEIFRNHGTFVFGSSDCGSGTTFTPSSLSTRAVLVSFFENGAWETLPSMNTAFAPQAIDSLNVGGYGSGDLLRVDKTSAQTVSAFTFTDYTKLVDLIAGKVNGFPLPSMASGQVLGSNGAGGWQAVTPLTATSVPTCAAGEYLRGSGGTLVCANLSGLSGAGTVTSVNASVPSFMSVSGGPITGSGTLAFDFTTQNAGLVFAGPSTGTGSPTFRALNIADIHSSVLGGFFQATGACAAGEMLTYSAVNDAVTCAPYTLAGSQVTAALGYAPVNKTGDAMTGALSVPADGLVVGTSQLVAAGGNVGIGTAAPAARLDVVGTGDASALIVPRDGTRPSAPVNGMIRYNTSVNVLETYAAGLWQSLAGAGTGAYLPLAGGALSGALNMNGNAIQGGTASGGSLTLDSTSDATKGNILLNPVGGKVGIGTVAPEELLDLRDAAGMAEIKISGTSAASTPASGIQFGDTSSPKKWGFGYRGPNFTAGSQTDRFVFQYSPDGSFYHDYMTLVPNNLADWSSGSVSFPGNVGIGTIAPAAKLDVNGQVRIAGGSPGIGKVLTSDAAGLASWQTPASQGLTSVGLTAPSELTITGSPLTANGSITASWTSQAANTFLAAPSSGAGTPSFRGIASADLPSISSGLSGTLPVANGGTGATTLTSGSLVVGNGTSAVTGVAAGTTGNLLYASSATAWSSGTPDTAGVVAKSGAQTIAGVKTFSAQPVFSAGMRLTSGASANFVLTSDASGNATWAANPGLTSVGFTAPSELTITGSPLTANGTIAAAWANQTQGRVFASPTGSTGAPTFRAIAASDLPSLATGMTGMLPVTNGGTGASTLPLGSILVGNGTSAVSSLAGGATGNLVYATGAAAFSSGTPDTAGVVAKTGAQTVAGVKTFSNQAVFSAGLQIPTGAGANLVLTSDASGNATWASLPAGISGSGTANYLTKWTAGNAVGNSLVYDNGTNVGIGTASPVAKLQIVGDAGADWKNASIWISNTGTGARSYSIGAGSDGNFTIGDQTASLARITLNSLGNVGIGTTAPSDFGGGAGNLMHLHSASTSAWGQLNIGSLATSSGVTVGVLGFGTTGTASTEKRSAQISSELTSASGTSPSGNLKFWTVNAGTISQRMTVDSTGNVGIGTTVPNTKLEVVGAITTPTNPVSAATVDLSKSNTRTLSAVGGNSITLSNMADGATYTLIITDTNSRTYTFAGCNASYFRPANGATTASTRTIYGILTVKNGATWDCYINWSSGYIQTL